MSKIKNIYGLFYNIYITYFNKYALLITRVLFYIFIPNF